ncbi:MAG: hypothetical protein NVS3B26_24960 [Mycobacteriales bacterium]
MAWVKQSDLVDVLSEFARTLSTDFPIQHVLDRLVIRIGEVLPALSAGITLIDSSMAPRHVAASASVGQQLELLQTRFGQGPCLEAYQAGQAVLVPNLDEDARFPRFAEAARAAGVGAVFAFPLRHGDARIGALDLYRATAGPLDADELSTAQTLADVATGYLLNAQARAEARRIADHFHHTSLHDPLTGLPNRTLLQERLDHASARAQRTHARAALMFLDLDGLKHVNDAYGHELGDQLLVAVADRLSMLLRPGDTFARLGGDEFVFLCEEVTDAASAEHLAERVTRAFDKPFKLTDRELTATASVGLAFSAADEPARQLLGRADAAMYEAKRRGGGRHVTDVAGAGRVADDRVSLGADLQVALATDQLEIAYQPVVRVSDGEVSGLEALIRWNRHGRGPVPPEVLIDIAEQQGLISRIGLWILRHACENAVERRRLFPDIPLKVAVNVSVAQLLGPGFCGAVQEVLTDTGMDPATLVLEVTESVMMHDPSRAVAVLADLRRLRIRTALDDFGTGFSSLGYLRVLPVDIVKFDRTFVADVTSPTGGAIIAAVSDLAHLLGMTVTAEGVETPAQRQALVSLGCDEAQGFLFARPMSGAALSAVLDAMPHGNRRLPRPRSVPAGT